MTTPAKRRQTSKGQRPSNKLAKTNMKNSGTKFNLTRKMESLGPLGFPNRLKMINRYQENITLNVTAAAFGFWQFSANGMFDPNITGTGHQPNYFDAMMNIYQHYTVIGSKMTVKILNPGPVDGLTILTYIDSSTSFGGAAPEFSSANQVQINENSTPVTLTSVWSAKATFGGNIYDNDELQGTNAANPAEQSYHTIAVDSPVTLASRNFRFAVTVDYIAVYDELKNTQIN